MKGRALVAFAAAIAALPVGAAFLDPKVIIPPLEPATNWESTRVLPSAGFSKFWSKHPFLLEGFSSVTEALKKLNAAEPPAPKTQKFAIVHSANKDQYYLLDGPTASKQDSIEFVAQATEQIKRLNSWQADNQIRIVRGPVDNWRKNKYFLEGYGSATETVAKLNAANPPAPMDQKFVIIYSDSQKQYTLLIGPTASTEEADQFIADAITGLKKLNQLEKANRFLKEGNGILVHGSVFDLLGGMEARGQQQMGGQIPVFKDAMGYVGLSTALLPGRTFAAKGPPKTSLYFLARKCQFHMGSPRDFLSDFAYVDDVRSSGWLIDGKPIPPEKSDGHRNTAMRQLRYRGTYCDRMFYLARLSKFFKDSRWLQQLQAYDHVDSAGIVEVARETFDGIKWCSEQKDTIFQHMLKSVGSMQTLEYPPGLKSDGSYLNDVLRVGESRPTLSGGGPRVVDDGKGKYSTVRRTYHEDSPIVDHIREAVNTNHYYLRGKNSPSGEKRLSGSYSGGVDMSNTEIYADCPYSALVGVNPSGETDPARTKKALEILHNNMKDESGERSKLLDVAGGGSSFWMTHDKEKAAFTPVVDAKIQRLEALSRELAGAWNLAEELPLLPGFSEFWSKQPFLLKGFRSVEEALKKLNAADPPAPKTQKFAIVHLYGRTVKYYLLSGPTASKQEAIEFVAQATEEIQRLNSWQREKSRQLPDPPTSFPEHWRENKYFLKGFSSVTETLTKLNAADPPAPKNQKFVIVHSAKHDKYFLLSGPTASKQETIEFIAQASKPVGKKEKEYYTVEFPALEAFDQGITTSVRFFRDHGGWLLDHDYLSGQMKAAFPHLVVNADGKEVLTARCTPSIMHQLFKLDLSRTNLLKDHEPYQSECLNGLLGPGEKGWRGEENKDMMGKVVTHARSGGYRYAEVSQNSPGHVEYKGSRFGGHYMLIEPSSHLVNMYWPHTKTYKVWGDERSSKKRVEYVFYVVEMLKAAQAQAEKVLAESGLPFRRVKLAGTAADPFRGLLPKELHNDRFYDEKYLDASNVEAGDLFCAFHIEANSHSHLHLHCYVISDIAKFRASGGWPGLLKPDPKLDPKLSRMMTRVYGDVFGRDRTGIAPNTHCGSVTWFLKQILNSASVIGKYSDAQKTKGRPLDKPQLLEPMDFLSVPADEKSSSLMPAPATLGRKELYLDNCGKSYPQAQLYNHGYIWPKTFINEAC